MVLHLMQFNNYYNRIVKRYDMIANYFMNNVVKSIPNVNFKPNNYINTEQVINFNIDSITADYMVVTNEKGVIQNRWFIVEAERLRQGQFKLTLRRDVLADFKNYLMQAPMFIEKGHVGAADPAVFNNEDMTFNQIKKDEILLFDETQTAWMVAYLMNDFTISDSLSFTNKVVQDIIVTNLSDYEYYKYINAQKMRTTNFYSIIFGGSSSNSELDYYTYKNTGGVILRQYNVKNVQSKNRIQISDVQQLKNDIATLMPTNNTFIQNNIQDYANDTILSFEEYQDILEQNGKVIYVSSTQSYYRIVLKKDSQLNENITFFDKSELGVKLRNVIDISDSATYNSAGGSGGFSGLINVANVQLSFELIPTAQTSATVTNVKTNLLNDAPYFILCAPLFDGIEIEKNGTVAFTNDQALVKSFFKELSVNIPSAKLLDIQILPYCPIRQAINNGVFDYGNLDSSRVVEFKQGNVIAGAAFWAYESNFSFILNYSYTVKDYKLENECDMWRLCSPNYAGSFEFNMAKNDGVQFINIDCTYKPINPFIHVNPNFNRLYGQNFNDIRGLVCNGDFSYNVLSDNWTNYEYQNKNYQLIFNRNIQAMELTNKYQNIQSIGNAITGTVSGGVSGAVTGGMLGGPIGALAGATVGTIGSSAFGAYDVYVNQKLRNEAINLQKDNFGYQLGNIKALGENITKISSYTVLNRYVPFLEYYSCTEEEKEALQNKIKYNGMTIMRIGTISQFLDPANLTFIKGQLIRLEDVCDDYVMFNTIASELAKGAFF